MAQPRSTLAGLAVVAVLLASCGDEELTGPPDSDNGLDPTVAPRVVATYPPDGGIGPFNLIVQGYETQPHFTIQLNKLIERHRFSQDWLRIEGFTDPARLELVDRSSSGSFLTDVLNVRVTSLATYRPLYYEIGQAYAVTVDTTLRDFTGRQPEQPVRFTFTPEPHFRVVNTWFPQYPQGQPVGPQDPVGLLFNAPPDANIGNSVAFSPAVPGQWTTYGDLGRAIFAHSQPFAFGTTYTLRVESTAMDRLGNRLPGPFVTSFQVQPFEIMGTSPRNGDLGVSAYARIWVRTNAVLDSTSVAQALHIEPAAPGRIANGITGFDFTPDHDLLAETQYTVTISTGLRAWDGTPLGAPYSFSFTTAPFRVLGTEPYDGSVGVDLADSIAVFFNSHLDPATVNGAFSIVPDAAGTLAVRDERASLIFLPSVPFAPATTYQVTISTALRGESGAAFLEPYTFGFTTAGQ